MDKDIKIVLLSVCLFLVILAVAITGFNSYSIVDAGYVGVKKTFGSVSNDSLNPGLHLKLPFITSVVHMDTRLKSFKVDTQAASKDLQKVSSTISVQHSLTPSMAPQVLQSVGDLESLDITIINPAVMESFKVVTAKYTAEELITKREIVKQQAVDEIIKFINHTLVDKNIPNGIHISNIALQDFQFSPEFDKSIEAKVKAQQEALRAQNEKLKRITEAEASAKEKELAADAEAYQIEKESISRAAAIEREAKAISENPLLLQLRSIERWDGKLPVYSNSGAVPFINLDKVK